MKYTFSFYTKDDFEEIESLIINSYNWEKLMERPKSIIAFFALNWYNNF